LHQDIQDVAVLIHRPPQIVMVALDRQKHFIQVPLVPGPRTTTTELISVLLTKLVTPFADRLIGHCHSTFTEELFHVAEAQTEPEVQPHGVADDVHGKAVILRFYRGGGCMHAATLTHRVATNKLTTPTGAAAGGWMDRVSRARVAGWYAWLVHLPDR